VAISIRGIMVIKETVFSGQKERKSIENKERSDRTAKVLYKKKGNVEKI
jgi:hypothetical protein